MKPPKISSAKTLVLLVLTFFGASSFADQYGQQNGYGRDNGGYQDDHGGYGRPGSGYGPGYGGNHGGGGYYPPRRGDLHDRREVERLVNLLYQGILFRTADPQGLNAFANVVLERGETGLIQTATMLGAVQEFKDLRNRQGSLRIVRNIYRLFFNREPDPSGMENWARLIDQDRGGEAMAGIVGSDEFYNAQLR